MINFTPLNISISKRISFIIGTCNSFFFNKYITFNSNSKSFSQLIKYFVVWGISFTFNTISHDFFIEYFNGYIPFLIATSISVLINFTGSKLWVFKKN